MILENAAGDHWLVSFEAFEIYSQCMYKPTFEEYKSEITDFSARRDVHIFVCYLDRQRVGLILLEKSSGNTAEIIGIAVKRDCKLRGIGRFMIYSAAHVLNVDFITAETDQDAFEFYQHSKFTVNKFIRHFPDADVVRYSCTLDVKNIPLK